jgi:hypothetical protein
VVPGQAGRAPAPGGTGAQVPDNTDVIQFGITRTGPGRVALRNPELTRVG